MKFRGSQIEVFIARDEAMDIVQVFTGALPPQASEAPVRWQSNPADSGEPPVVLRYADFKALFQQPLPPGAATRLIITTQVPFE